MMIELWETIWFWVLLIVLSVFGILTVVVGIGGFYDVQALLRSMADRHRPGADDGEDNQLS
jgi:hypothetical protein